MLRVLLSVPDKIVASLQSCPCHGHGRLRSLLSQTGDDEPHGPESCSVSSICPMRGRRAPELAAGFLDDVFHDLLETASVSFPGHSDLFQDYSAGLTHMTFLLQLKFSFWKRLPYSLLALAHPDEEVARRNAAACLGEWQAMGADEQAGAHVLSRKLLSAEGGNPVQRSLLAFLDGASRDSDECSSMRDELGKVAFLPLLERSYLDLNLNCLV